MSKYYVRLEDLTKEKNGKTIIEQINVTIDPGAIVAITGPSGAGKSSLLRLINRLDEPTHGTVYLNDTDYRTLQPQELRRTIGMLMQQAYLFPGTIAKNIRFGPEQRGESLDQEKIDELLVKVDLPGFAERDIATLSGGEAQRVSLARTLANHPDILLLDEPTSSLDPDAQMKIEQLISNIIKEEGLTCLMVTHNRTQAKNLATHILSLEQGKMINFGKINEVWND